jgi:hypothetical protein
MTEAEPAKTNILDSQWLHAEWTYAELIRKWFQYATLLMKQTIDIEVFQQDLKELRRAEASMYPDLDMVAIVSKVRHSPEVDDRMKEIKCKYYEIINNISSLLNAIISSKKASEEHLSMCESVKPLIYKHIASSQSSLSQDQLDDIFIDRVIDCACHVDVEFAKVLVRYHNRPHIPYPPKQCQRCEVQMHS